MEIARASLTIRQASRDDARAIAEIHVAAWRAAYRGLMPQEHLDALSVEKRSAFWRGQLSSPSPSKVAVSEAGGVIAGFCNYGPTRDDDDQGSAEIYAIYVQPGSWRRGCGRALCERAFLDASARECRAVTAWVLKSNRPGRDFYQRLGFTADGAERSDAKRGFPLQEMRYRKVIA